MRRSQRYRVGLIPRCSWQRMRSVRSEAAAAAQRSVKCKVLSGFASRKFSNRRIIAACRQCALPTSIPWPSLKHWIITRISVSSNARATSALASTSGAAWNQSLYITEICKIIGVAERTLEVCCQEQLGVGPKRYLLLRRLQLARRALREAAPDRTTVTDIATRYGFWHFGRFAGAYQSLFGEFPSVTLHRQAEQPRNLFAEIG